jgi:ubiquitin C-terminal hydrolase
MTLILYKIRIKRKECQRSNSLIEGISSFFAIEKLEGTNKYLCEKCKVRSNARKRFILDTVPKVVTFQLKRFTNSMRKIGKFIQYPLTIDLGKHL